LAPARNELFHNDFSGNSAAAPGDRGEIAALQLNLPTPA
jgi:hypothetical protein